MLNYKSHISLPYLGAGRVRIMLDGLHARAAEKGIAPIAERVEAIMPIHAEWHRLWAGWQAQKDQRADGDARRLDQELDKAVRAIYRNVVDLADAPIGDALGDEARRVLDLHFPHGLQGVTQVLYEEQALKCQALLDHLRADPDRPRRLRCDGWVDSVADLLPRYRRALAVQVRIAWPDVLAAREATHEALACAIGLTWGLLWREAEVREYLLAPIEDQLARAAAYRARRRRGAEAPADSEEAMEALEGLDDGAEPAADAPAADPARAAADPGAADPGAADPRDGQPDGLPAQPDASAFRPAAAAPILAPLPRSPGGEDT